MDEKHIADLSDPAKHSIEEAVSLTKLLLKSDPLIDVRLAHSLPGKDGEPTALTDRQCERLLHILDIVSPGRRLIPILGHLVRHPNARLRSKAALFLARRVDSGTWAERYTGELDGRVRANVIEGLWGVDLPSTRQILREAVHDSAPRVVGNAIFGMLLVHDPLAPAKLNEIARSDDPRMRATAAWVMGMSGDKTWVEPLKDLMRDTAAPVRSSALRAMARLRKTTAAEQTRHQIPISTR